MKELSYPVLALPRNDDMIYVFFKEKDLKATSEELLRKVDYTELDLIDAFGRVHRVRKAFKVKYLGLWGFNPFLKGRQILVDFEYAPEVSEIHLSVLKNDILNRIEKKRGIWQSGWSVNELKNAVSNSSSVREIATFLK